MKSPLETRKKVLLVLEGNIGAGKSTFLRILKENLDLDIIFEPVAKWQNVGPGGNLLNLFYADIKRWAYTFQSYAFITRVEAQLEALEKSEHDIQILERSVYCDRYCFAQNCFESGNMSALEWQIYREWFSWLVEGHLQKPDGFIYLQASPEICKQRLEKRNRSEEIGVSIEYLQKLHNRHEDWLVHKKDLASYLVSIPVLTLNCDLDFENNLARKNQLLDNVQNFISTLKGTVSLVPEKSTQVQI
jgi:deoxyadenosine/deoxycytidine kinase